MRSLKALLKYITSRLKISIPTSSVKKGYGCTTCVQGLQIAVVEESLHLLGIMVQILLSIEVEMILQSSLMI